MWRKSVVSVTIAARQLEESITLLWVNGQEPLNANVGAKVSVGIIGKTKRDGNV